MSIDAKPIEPTSEQATLWNTALADAGQPDDIELVITAIAPDEPYEHGCWYYGPGANLRDTPGVKLTPAERAHLMRTIARPRVAIYQGTRLREFLANARWTLELDRQRRINPNIPMFGGLVNHSLDDVVSGPGSAVVWHCLPHVKDADLASAYLIERQLGPQTGDLRGPYGISLRTDRPAPDLTTLPRRLTVAGAIFTEHLAAVVSSGDSIAVHLGQLDPDAPGWWERLQADEGFEHLRKSLRFYIPSESDIEAVLELQGQASRWRGWETHFYLSLDYGLSLLD